MDSVITSNNLKEVIDMIREQVAHWKSLSPVELCMAVLWMLAAAAKTLTLLFGG